MAYATGPRLLLALVGLAGLLLGSGANAQQVSASPDTADMTTRAPVVLRVTKADGSEDPSLVEQVKSVEVGDQQATIQRKDAERITIVPPELGAGRHAVRLLGDAGKVLASGELRYQSATSGLPIQELERRRAEDRRDQLAGYDWYYVLVTLMFLGVVAPFVLAIYRGTSPSRSSANRPLGLPVGSFRAILAYSLVAYLGFYVLTSILSVSQFAPPDFLLGIIATVIGFYFGSRSGDEGDGVPKTGIIRGSVTLGTAPARGALVKFKRAADATEPYSRITDLNGRFELSGVTPGKYKVSASLTGSAPSDEQEVSVAEGSDHEIALVITAAASAPSTPAQTGTVQGTVSKPDGSPAPQANVVLSQGGIEKAKKTTEANGSYKIDAVAAGDYEVGAILAPYTPSDKAKVTVAAGGRQTVNLKLK